MKNIGFTHGDQTKNKASTPKVKKMKIWFWILLICTAAISVFQAQIMHRPELIPRGYEGGAIIGESIGVFLAYTIIPFIWWTFLKFKWSKAYGPMLTWTLIMLFFAPLSLYGALHS